MSLLTIFWALAMQPQAPSPPPSSTIDFIAAHPERFHGRRVQIRGWLTRNCQPLDCNLSDAPYWRAGVQSLSIGADDAFDRMIKDWVPAEVIIEARINADCLTRYLCLDRAPVLNDARLLRVLREGLPPAN